MLTQTEKAFPQPTLSLYLGGTGVMVGERLLALLDGVDAQLREFIEPFFIDSQEPRIDCHDRARHYCYTDLERFFEPVYEQFARKRFPENLGVNPVYNSSDGCGVTRIFGAASLAACLDDFADLVESALGRLKSRRRGRTQPLQVFLTASACGGTGAGMILDAAALVRHFFRLKGENPRIYLFLLGPDAFVDDPLISLRSEQRDRMRASTYALLKELHHFADGGRFVSSYRLRDETLDIGNIADDDRLFEWVYFINGGSQTIAEVIGVIAETQLHLCLTEVGRKVAESMPNQREERVRTFPLNFVHPDNKEQLTPAAHKRLEVAGRKTHLASFGLRNVRFPVAEIKEWLRAGWLRDGLRKMVERDDERSELSLVDQFDRILGFDGNDILPQGLFAELQLTRDDLLAPLGGSADPLRNVPPPPAASAAADSAVSASEKLLAVADDALAQAHAAAVLLSPGTDDGRSLPSIAALAERATHDCIAIWQRGLAQHGRIAERLLSIAWKRNGGRGLLFLDGLLEHASTLLIRLASQSEAPPGVADLEEQIDFVRSYVSTVKNRRDYERRGIRHRVRKSIASLMRKPIDDGDELRRRTRSLIAAATALRIRLAEQRRAALASALAPRVWLAAAQLLARWRDEALAPAIQSVRNAVTLAENRHELARHAIGESADPTTTTIADDALLDALAAELKVSVEDLLLVPLQEEGISRERIRVTTGTLGSLDRDTIVSILAEHIERTTRQRLICLDDAWMLPAVAKRLRTDVPRILDGASEPLTAFSRDEVGPPVKGYFLAPSNLALPNPYGRRVGRMERLPSATPHQLSIVTFTFGIPPNALAGIGELFQQYAIHVGDQEWHRGAHDRYPMHVFARAAEELDEPYSPLYAGTGDDFMRTVVAAAIVIWRDDVQLDIRMLDVRSELHLTDWNRCVELTEKILRFLCRWPDAAEHLFDAGRFAELKHLFDSRRHKAASTWIRPDAFGGNGRRQGRWMFDDQEPFPAGSA